MSKKKLRVTHVAAVDLLQLQQTKSDELLAKERVAHQITRGQLLVALEQVSLLRQEVDRLRDEKNVIDQKKSHNQKLKECVDAQEAHATNYERLVRELRDRYCIEAAATFDPMSGEIIART